MQSIPGNPIPNIFIIRTETEAVATSSQAIPTLSPSALPEELSLTQQIEAIAAKREEYESLFVICEQIDGEISEIEEQLHNINAQQQHSVIDPESPAVSRQYLSLAGLNPLGDLHKIHNNLAERLKALEKHEIPQCEKQMHKMEKNLLTQVNNILGEKVIEQLPLVISRCKLDVHASISQQLSRYCRQLSLALTNQITFLREVRKKIEANRTLIIQEFGSGKENELKDAQIKLQLLGGDMHCKGKSPILVTFHNGDENALKIVYKPRSAETDIAALQLFSDLNKLIPEQKGNPYVPDLPFYKIVPIENGKESLWEFIEGKPLLGISHAENHLSTLSDSLKEKANDQLERLERVCQAACIKDLHIENILFLDGQFIPVDLEVITPRDATRLYETKNPKLKLPPLSPHEENLIAKFLEVQKSKISRYVPITTSEFTNNMWIPDGPKVLTNMILDELKKNMLYEIMNTAEEVILHGIKDDFERIDIPIFSRNKEGIYYDSILPNNLIAQKRDIS